MMLLVNGHTAAQQLNNETTGLSGQLYDTFH